MTPEIGYGALLVALALALWGSTAAAIGAAKAAPTPAEETVFTDVWADGGAAWRT